MGSADHRNEKFVSLLFFGVFFAFIFLSIIYTYQRLYVERHYSVFMTEEEVEASYIDLWDVVRQRT